MSGTGLRRGSLVLPILILSCLLAGCANRAGVSLVYNGGASAGSRGTAPPGPPDDPWQPYIIEAAARFQVPERWIRRVMRQESGGQADIVSSAGAIGLMQVMPATYEGLRQRYALGEDPFDPHDNLLAGTAYLREMYDRYGSPGFLAAYNAGPNRVDDYLANGNPLPDETVNYVAAIAPGLGDLVPLSGPLAVYASGGGQSSAGCDPDAAYDPARPCPPAPSAQTVVAMAPSPPPTVTPHVQLASAAVPAPAPRADVDVAWSIQLGAFADPSAARTLAERTRFAFPDLLGASRIALPVTAPFGGTVLYRARLGALSERRAEESCARLNALQLSCMVVSPGSGS